MKDKFKVSCLYILKENLIIELSLLRMILSDADFAESIVWTTLCHNLWQAMANSVSGKQIVQFAELCEIVVVKLDFFTKFQ